MDTTDLMHRKAKKCPGGRARKKTCKAWVRKHYGHCGCPKPRRKRR